MTESIRDKLIKLGVSYYDGPAPAAPPIRGIDGSTEGYNQVITNPYGEQGVTPSPVQGTLDNLPVQSVPAVQQQTPTDVVEMPVIDEPVSSQPIQTPVQNIPVQEVPYVPQEPYDYRTVQQQMNELNTRYTPQEAAKYYLNPAGLLEKKKWLKTGDPLVDAAGAFATATGNIIPSGLQYGTGMVAAGGLGISAAQGFEKLQRRLAVSKATGKNLDEATWAKYGLDLNDPDIQTFLSVSKPALNIANDIQTGNKPLSESWAENIAQPLADMLDYSFLSPKIIGSAIRGDISPQQALELSMNRLVENPVDNAIDLATAGLAAAPKSIVNIGKLIKAGKAGEAAQITKDLGRIRATQAMEPVAEAAEELAKHGDKSNFVNVIKSAEEGGVHLTPKEVSLKSQLRDMMQKYHNILQEYGLATDPALRTVAQYITRKTGVIHNEALKSILPFFENPEFINIKDLKITDAGLEYIEHNGKINPALNYIQKAVKGFKNGELFPVTHANADAASLMAEGKTAGLDRKFFGQYSDMVNGLASYEGMAEQFANPNYLSWEMGMAIEQKAIANEIKALAEETKATGDLARDTKWISPEELDAVKNVEDIPAMLQDTPARPDYLPVSQEFADRLKDTVEISKDFSSPYRAGSFPDKAYKFFRQFALSKGMYLSGNVASSTYQTLMNSNINLLRDLNDTFQTQGKLSRIAGTARPIKPYTREGKSVLDKFQELTLKPTSSVFQYLDAKQQNMASEIALNNYLAGKGIPVQKRVDYLKNVKDPTVITEMLERAHDVAGLNTGFSLLPRNARPIVAMLDPFWRWKDTATRATLRGIKRQPILNNLVLHKGLGMMAFNQEMQHRMRVQADTNKPLVHVMYNPKTGMFRDQSAIWSPQAQSVQLLGGTLQAIRERNIQPAIEKALPNTNPVGFGILNSFQGKDIYGNPLYREETLGGNPVLTDYNKKQRHEITPEGEAKPLGTQADEVVAQLIRNTVAPVGLVDDTGSALLQTAASSLGYDINKYNPNGNAVMSSLNANAPWVNPNSPRTPDMAVSRLLGIYTTPEYDPLRDYEKLTPRQRVQLMKQRTKQMNKRLINRNIYGGR